MDQNDLKQIGDLIDVKFEAKWEKLEGKLLDWKSEIIDAVDKMADEIRTERDFRTITTHQISELEKKVGVDE